MRGCKVRRVLGCEVRWACWRAWSIHDVRIRAVARYQNAGYSATARRLTEPLRSGTQGSRRQTRPVRNLAGLARGVRSCAGGEDRRDDSVHARRAKRSSTSVARRSRRTIPSARCLPTGLPVRALLRTPFKIIQTPPVDGDPVRIADDVPADSDGRASTARGRLAGVERLLGWPLAGRHVRRGHHRIQRQAVARSGRATRRAMRCASPSASAAATSATWTWR